jgi:AbiV family abortive infection protein
LKELSAEEALAGIQAAVRNAKRLALDARLLLEAKRYPSAASLAALSIEESGKVSILRGIAATPIELLKSGWKEYRDHRSKNRMWIIPDLVRQGAKTAFDLTECVDRDGEHTAILDSLKQIGFYTDCYEQKHWSVPDKLVDSSVASSLVETAELLLTKRDMPLRELQLYVQIMKPVYGSSQMALKLLDFHEALKREGLQFSSDEEIQEYVQNILGKGPSKGRDS